MTNNLMRFERVLLLRPSYKGSAHGRGYSPPNGLGYIAETLKRNNIFYEVLDMTLGYEFEDLVRLVKTSMPTLICLGMMTYMHEQTYETINMIKRRFPNIEILVGGQHASNFREVLMEDCGSVDFCVVLDGEFTILELCQGKPVEEIKGLMFRREGKIVYNGDRPFVTDLDKIPFPMFVKFEMEKYSKYINIVSSRGCPDLCTFCPVHLTIGRDYRFRSAESVVREIKYWYDKGFRGFGFIDDNFTLVKGRVYEICDLIEKGNFVGARFECPNGIRADRVDYPLLKRMKEVGLSNIAYGVESADPKVLELMKKGETIEQIDEAIKWASDLGMNVSLFFIIGNVGDTLESVKKSFEFALKYPLNGGRVYFFSVMPFPRTELYKWIKENGRMIMDYKEYFNREQEHYSNIQVFDTPEFTVEQRKKAFRLSRNVIREVDCREYVRRVGNMSVVQCLGVRLLFFKPIYFLRNNKVFLDNLFWIYQNLFPHYLQVPMKKLYRLTISG